MYIGFQLENRDGEYTGTTLTVQCDYRKGHFFSHPRNEAEYLDPGTPDVVKVIDAVAYKAKTKNSRAVKIGPQILKMVEDYFESVNGYRPIAEY